LPSFKLTLAYDGTDYVGWQRQPSGTSIQSLVEDALRELDARDVPVAGAGRTDAGVHARGQVASCTLQRSIDAATVARALNARLPADVRVVDAIEAPPTFHARFDARSKTYRYRIWNREVLNPFERRYVWHVVHPLDVDAMAAAARAIEGTHDFAAFQGADSDARSTVRTITHCGLRIADCGLGSGSGSGSGLIEVEVEGDGFLRHMVRSIVGTLVEIGRGRRGAESMAEVVASRDRAMAGRTAPPHGLFLESVTYGGNLAAER
jgi:tRNA pseudouridine38-40 synthase